MKNLHQSLKVAKQQVKRLEDKVTKMMKRKVFYSKQVTLLVYRNATKSCSDSPQRIFWE